MMIMNNNSITAFMEIIAINDSSRSSTKWKVRKRKQKVILMIPNYEETTLSFMQRKHHILIPVRKLLYHCNSFCLKDLSVSMLSPSCKFCYYCPEDKVWKLSDCALGLIIFILFKNCFVWFYSYLIQHEPWSRYYYCVAYHKLCILLNIQPFCSYN